MDRPHDATVLILASQATAARWAGMLQKSTEGGQFHVFGQDLGLMPRTVAVGDASHSSRTAEVVLTDRPQPDTSAWPDVGIVKVGAEGPADVRLPDDCTPRELQLACRMLAEIVRLRRKQQQATQLEQQLSAAAMIDPLVGLPNRRAWEATLAERLAESTHSRRLLCLAILDLDHFKQVNDEYGHPTGDELLRAVGRAICDNLRGDDFVARLGGDEFGLILWVRDRDAAAMVVSRVQAGIPCYLATHKATHITASAGYCLHPSGLGGETASAEALYVSADVALREAKRRGRNQTVESEGLHSDSASPSE